MGKRGPAPKGDYAGKSKVLSTRITPETRTHLEAASKATGRSLSQEIEHRLARTFRDDRQIESVFGSRRNFMLMRLIAAIAATPHNPKHPGADWLDDPFLFDQVAQSISVLLPLVRPQGHYATVAAADSPDRLNSLLGSAQGAIATMKHLQAIHSADPALPLGQGSPSEHFAAVMKSDLGDVIARAKGRSVVMAEQPTRKKSNRSSKGRAKR